MTLWEERAFERFTANLYTAAHVTLKRESYTNENRAPETERHASKQQARCSHLTRRVGAVMWSRVRTLSAWSTNQFSEERREFMRSAERQRREIRTHAGAHTHTQRFSLSCRDVTTRCTDIRLRKRSSVFRLTGSWECERERQTCNVNSTDRPRLGVETNQSWTLDLN